MNKLTVSALGVQTPVPIERWGKDHLTTILYAETRAVDYRGRLDDAQMRTGREYPTRLKGDVDVEGHTDYDCLFDAESYGFLKMIPAEVARRDNKREDADKAGKNVPVRVWGSVVYVVEFTPLGFEFAHTLRAERARGKNVVDADINRFYKPSPGGKWVYVTKDEVETGAKNGEELAGVLLAEWEG